MFSTELPELPEDELKDEEYLKLFLEYFINVKNCNARVNLDLQYEGAFRENMMICEAIIEHLITFGTTIIDFANNDVELSKIGLLNEKDSQHLLVYILKLIRIFSRQDPVASIIGTKSGIQFISRAMAKYQLCIQLQINSSACLANLASIEDNRNIMLKDGCLQLVLENLSRFMQYPEIQAEICATLANLGCHDSNAKYITENGGIQLILKAMRNHLTNVDFQIQAFHALAGLGKAGKEIMDRENVMIVSLKCAEMNLQDPELLSAAWHAIGALANSGVLVTKFQALVKLIFHSMKVNKLNHQFHVTACYAIAHLFFNSKTSVDSNENLIAEIKGIELILDSMRTFPGIEPVQTTSLFALGSIVMRNGIKILTLALNQDILFRNGGIELILSTMRNDYLGNDLKASSNGFGIASPSIYAISSKLKALATKPLLLQLFGSVCLLNLSESSIHQFDFSCLPRLYYFERWYSCNYHGFD